MPDRGIVSDLPDAGGKRSGMEIANSPLPRAAVWAASASAEGSAWHVVRKLGGWLLPTECGEWVCGPFHVRRGDRPAAPLGRAVCGGCLAEGAAAVAA